MSYEPLYKVQEYQGKWAVYNTIRKRLLTYRNWDEDVVATWDKKETAEYLCEQWNKP